ncbi:cupin domain-containing protein [Bradyrhizobium sp. Pha-3]|uniref:cupin domain-containing protein n=1 Tax=Bradyrhizobium sp. Pha-3 TaxID=208375 RepID=UPI0035D4901B
MTNRLIVTNEHDTRSSVEIDEQIRPNPFASVPGFDHALLWGTPAAPSVPWNGRNVATESKSILPAPGESRLMLVTYPPDSVTEGPGFDSVAATAEYLARMPGLAERFEPDNPGMHLTDSVDYVIVLDGEVWLELDERAIGPIQRGDIVVQNGTRHAWRNRSDKPATLVFVFVGAKRAYA